MLKQVFISFAAVIKIGTSVHLDTLTQVESNGESESQFFHEMVSSFNDWNCGKFASLEDAIACNFACPKCGARAGIPS